MLSKMAQPNNVGGPASGRRVSMSLTGAGAAASNSVSRLQQSAGSNGRSKSPQNSNAGKKNESNIHNGPFVAIKKSSATQLRSACASSTSPTASISTVSQNDEKIQNGVNKSANANQKSQNGSSSVAIAKDQQKQQKEKQTEKNEPPKSAIKEDVKPSKSESKATAAPSTDAKKIAVVYDEIIDLDAESEVAEVNKTTTTPTSERKSLRRGVANHQKSPIEPEQRDSAISKIQPEEVDKPTAVDKSSTADKPAAVDMPAAVINPTAFDKPAAVLNPTAVDKPTAVLNPTAVDQPGTVESQTIEDVEMETPAAEASPIRSVANAQPAATSTPGRNLFGFRSSCNKLTNEVELAAQLSNSPISASARTFSQISGRRSIRSTTALTPGKLGSYRCVTSDLDTSNCTNTSMNATVGSEIANSSSFSFSFFGRGRKRERTPPPLIGSQSDNDVAQQMEMSPPKRARFDLFNLNLASPFTMLRSRFSKTTISTPSSRQCDNQTPPSGEDEDGGEVQNVSGIINQEEEDQLVNKSSSSHEITVGQEAGLDTPKESDMLVKEVQDDKIVDDQGVDVVANLPVADEQVAVEGEGPNRSRCAIM